MKIAMPVNDKSMESGVCLSFGRAPYYLIYESDSEEFEFIDNSAAASQGGAGIKAAQQIVDEKVEAVLAPRCGQNAADVIEAAGIKIYQTEGESIQDNLTAFAQDKLLALDEIHAGFHRHRGR